MRSAAGFVLAPLVFFVLYLMPAPSLSAEAHKLLAVVGAVLVLWLSEAVPLPAAALIGAVLNIMLGVAPAKTVLAPFADPLVFLFIGSFILAASITHHGLDRRFAFAIFSIRFLEESPLRLLFTFGLISAVASMWISNTAATAMMLPIGVGVLGAMGEMRSGAGGGPRRDRFSTAMMLMIAYGASVGGIATPIGTPPNIIGIGMMNELIGVKVTFFEWMVFALPITAAMFLYLFLIVGPLYSRSDGAVSGVAGYVAGARARLGPMSRGEKNTAAAFAAAVVLWVLPSIVGLAAGKDSEIFRLLASRLNSGIVAVAAASLLFVLPVSWKERRFTMDWGRAARIDWGTILLFGGGLSLGKLMFSTGLAEAFGRGLTGLTGASELWAITAIGTLLAIILSETTSNTASANMVIPVVIAVAQGAGVPAMPPALGACLGASFGFMLPVSTPPNAIVYGSGLVPILTMVRKGILFDIGGFAVIMAGLMILCPLMGWT
ncbi:MAG TPA: DASS family sodium-coupled anion symporter [Deltaproteobacteria bacterium]|nr:DASS family sodium-coupled anion symporter [Deltaproteobacteria bacterium]